MEGALHGEALDRAAGMRAAGIGMQLGVDVGNAAGQRHRFGTGIEREETRVRALAAGMADFLAQRAGDAQLRQARAHHVGHHLRAAHRLDDVGRRVAEAEHAVAAGVVHDATLQRDHPRTAGGEGDIGADGVFVVEIDEARLHGLDLRLFVEFEHIGELALDRFVLGDGGMRGVGQFWETFGQAKQAGVVESDGADATSVGAQGLEDVDQVHGVLRDLK